MNIKFISLVVIGLLISFYGRSDDQDTASMRKNHLLISDMNIQIETTEAINNTYNFKFDKAAARYRWLRYKFHEHPLPYFLLGLNEWWKIIPNIEDQTYDDRFVAYMDTTIMKAEKLHEVDTGRVEAAFFLAASYGFLGRFYSDRSKWFKAATAANKALDYLEECRGKEYLSPELMFGDGLFNYFSVWIGDNYPNLRPFLMWFDKGDKGLGLEQLKEVATNAFYTRTEAQYWLMRILYSEENDVKGAIHFSEYLHQTYPDNAFFHRYYARMLFSTGRWMQAKTVSENILEKLDSGMVGYEATSGRYAGFYLGKIWENSLDNEKALKYYKRAIDFGEEVEAYESGYYLYSLMGAAQICHNDGDDKQAKEYLKAIRKHAKRSHPTHQQAREFLKSI